MRQRPLALLTYPVLPREAPDDAVSQTPRSPSPNGHHDVLPWRPGRLARAVLTCMVLATSAVAAPATDAPDKQAAPAIAARADASDDADIAARIRDIFG